METLGLLMNLEKFISSMASTKLTHYKDMNLSEEINEN